MYNPFSLEGKTILVTGASSGIGRSTAIECSKLGAKIVITGRNQTRLQETLSLLNGVGHEMHACDLTEESDLSLLVNNVPPLNGIVHCAGVSVVKMVKFLDSNSLNYVFKCNVFAPLLLNSGLLRRRKLLKGSSIVIVSSISGVYATQVGEAEYGATKAALAGYIKSTALELAPQGTRINCIYPGVIETPLLKNNESLTEEDLNNLKKKYPLKRFGQPEEVAHCAIYLLSDASSFMTGAGILLDGGFTLS